MPFHKSVGLIEELLAIASEEGKPITEYIPAAILEHKDTISINNPRRSLCPKCQHQLLWWHNIPVISWLLLRGKCAFCQVHISIRYPLVEIVSALCAVLSVWCFGLTVTALCAYLFAALMIVISLIDYDWYIIPDLLSITGTVLSIVISTANGYFHFLTLPFAQNLSQAMWGIACGAGFLWLVAKFYLTVRKQEGLGLGDVKLLALIGALFGPVAALWTIFAGSVLGTIGGVLMMILARRGMSHPLPFGPYLAAAAMVFLFWKDNPLLAPLVTLTTGY